MRYDFILNMININRRERMRKRRTMALLFLCVCAVGYLGIVLSLAFFKGSDVPVAEQIVVTTAEPKAAAKPVATPTYRPAGKITRVTSQPAAATTKAPEHTWKSTSNTAVKVHTTSSATVKSIGGGGVATSSRPANTTVFNPSSAFGVSTSIMVVPTLARVSSRSLTADNTRAAEAEVIESTSQGRAAKPGIRKVDGDDDPLEPFQDTVPLGSGLWILLFLVATYGAVMVYRRKNA